MNGGISYKQFLDYLEDKFPQEISKNIFDILFDYSLVGLKNEWKYYYKCRGTDIPDGADINTFEVILPKCIYHHYRDISL